MRRRKILVADLLCGAGGSSTGCEQALRELGLEMELVCLNHWPVAIETHKLNHPKARHICQDISTVRPHIIVPEGYLDLLMASPTCTHHSVARGGKPTSDQQRSDPWHIITWFTELRVKRAIIENVWEFISWGPVDPRTGKPIKERKGEYFRAWVDTIWKLGATSIEYRKLNAADYGDATTRQRFIMIIRFDKKPIVWPAATHRKREEGKLELFPGLKPWKPARDIIDWGIRGRSIFTRKKSLAPKTLARIYAGAVKFGWPEPFLVILRNHMAGQSVDGPLPTIAASGTHIGLAQPVLVKQNFRRDVQGVDEPTPTIMTQARIGVAEAVVCGNRTNNTAKSADEPVGGITTTTGGGQFLVEPVIISPRHGREGAGPQPRSVAQPLPTLTAGGSQVGVAEPVVVRTNMHGRLSPGARGAEDPLMTITTDGGIGVAEPVIVNGRKNNQAKGVSTEPVPALDTKGGVWLATPVTAVPTFEEWYAKTEKLGSTRQEYDRIYLTADDYGRKYYPEDYEALVMGTGNGGAARSTGEPLPTITTGGAANEERPGCARPMLVEPLILNRHSAPRGETRPVSEPAPTPTTSGAGYLVEPFVLSRQGGGAPRSIDEPTPAQVAKHSHVLAAPYYGSGSGETCGSAEEPLPTISTRDRFGVVIPVTNGSGGAEPRSVDEPVPTMTTAKRGEFAVVVPVTHAGGEERAIDPEKHPLPTVTGANRGELGFITAQFGEREGQAPRVHDIEEPTPAICAQGHINLVEATPEYDILFRMLEPHELAGAMGFNSEDGTYEFSGNKTQQIKQIGNAVSVAKMRACVRSIMADAVPKRSAKRVQRKRADAA